MHPSPARRRPGLTLLELLVVLVIMGLLALLVIPLLAQTETRKTREAARVVAGVIAKAQTLAISGGQGASVRFNQMNPQSKAFSEIAICGPKRCYRGETPTARCRLVETGGLGPDMLNHLEWWNSSLTSPEDRQENHDFYEMLPATTGDFLPAALGLGGNLLPFAILRLDGRDPLYQIVPTQPKSKHLPTGMVLELDANGKAITNDRLWVSKAANYVTQLTSAGRSDSWSVLPNVAPPALDPATHTFEIFLDGKPTGPPVTLPYDRAFDPRWLVYVSGSTSTMFSEYSPFDDWFTMAVTGQTAVRYWEVEIFDDKGRPQMSDQRRTDNNGLNEQRAVMAMLVGRADRAGQAWQQADLTDDDQGANWQYPDSHWVVVLPVRGSVLVESCAPITRVAVAGSRSMEAELHQAAAYIRQTVRSLMP